MQSLAAYSFEAIVEDPSHRLQRVDELIDDWLVRKGVEDCRASDGDFTSKTGDGTGQFSRRHTVSTVGSAEEVELLETADTGEVFTTTLEVTIKDGKVTIFASMGATPGKSAVAPIKLYPRCPGVIRALIEEFDDWAFAGQELPVGRAFDATNPAAAYQLCGALRSDQRRLPLVVVSVDPDEQVWPELPAKAAEQLIGLADVAFVDAESSWVLTDELGPRDSCFLGSVRLYWPVRRRDGSHEGVTWMAPRLVSFGEGDAGMNRFLALLRRMVMSTAALTMLQPSSFREVQRAATKEKLDAVSGPQRNEELIVQNERLVADLEDARRTIDRLQWKLNASAYAQRGTVDDGEDDEQQGQVDSEEHAIPPMPGETRYYKKIGSGGGVDSLIQTKKCNHKSSNWASAFKGDQAEKGLLKLEGRNNWKNIAHCSACTGGGRWRVNW